MRQAGKTVGGHGDDQQQTADLNHCRHGCNGDRLQDAPYGKAPKGCYQDNDHPYTRELGEDAKIANETARQCCRGHKPREYDQVGVEVEQRVDTRQLGIGERGECRDEGGRNESNRRVHTRDAGNFADQNVDTGTEYRAQPVKREQR